MQQFFQALLGKKDQIIDLSLQHLQLTLVAIVIAVVIGVPVGIFITRNKRLANIVIGFANLVQAIPSLALLGFLIPVVGIGSTPSIIMVVLYSMLPIVKNTYTGLTNINPDMLEAATGIGLTRNQTLRLVKLPLAVPIIMSGVRIAAVTAVGLMTIAAFVGAGGLGYLVYSGIQTVDTNLILLGAIPAAILALLIDFVVGKIENIVVPNGIHAADGEIKIKRKRFSIFPKKKLAIAAITIIIFFLGYGAVQSMSQKDTITIATKNFTEQLILGNLLADLIEDRTELQVERKLNLGGTQVVFGAIQKGEIDLYAEYSGTAYAHLLNYELKGSENPDDIYETSKKGLKERDGLVAFKPLGFNNTYAMTVTQETAKKYNLKTVSDLTAISDQLILGPTFEFASRDDGLLGMKKVYQTNFSDVKSMDGALRYSALDSGEVDVVDGFTTDGLIEKYNLVLLKDDKEFFLPYYAFPLVRKEVLDEHPELEKVLNELAGKISDDTMRKLNYQVDVEGKDPKDVAHEYLVSENLIVE